MTKSKSEANQFLSWILFITSSGDFLSIFVYVLLLNQVLKDPVFAGMVLPIKGAGAAVGALFFPTVLSRIGNRALLISTQVLLGVITLFLIGYWVSSPVKLPIVILIVCFLESVLAQLFSAGRENYSKCLEHKEAEGATSPALNEQRLLQAQLERGFLAGQFIGPLSFFVLVGVFQADLTVPLILDAFSFFLAGFLCFQLPKVGVYKEKLFILRPLRYLLKTPGLFEIFFLRAFAMWISLGLFNLLLFPITAMQYSLDLVYSTWTYSAIGLGAWAAVKFMGSNKERGNGIFASILGLSDPRLAMVSFFLYGAAELLFGYSTLLWVGFLAALLVGAANGVQKVTTRAITRKFTTAAQYPEVLGLEFFIARLTDLSVAFLFLWASQYGWTYHGGLWVSAVGFWVFALVFLSGRFKGAQNN
jgi:MFS family permease